MLLREACLKILIKVLVDFLCYIEILNKYFFTIIYVLCHTKINKDLNKKNETRFPRKESY